MAEPLLGDVVGHTYLPVLSCLLILILLGCEQPSAPVSQSTGTPTIQQASPPLSQPLRLPASQQSPPSISQQPTPLQHKPEGNERLSVTAEGNRLVNDIGIAQFPTPSDWLPNRSGRNTSVILVRKGNSPAKQPDEMISIDVGTPTAADVKSSAAGLATKFGGTASEMPDKIDGEVMYRVSVPPNYNQLMPRECIVVHHGGKVCFIFGASKTRDEIWPIVSEIVESWRWN